MNASKRRKTGRPPATVGGENSRLQQWLDANGFTSVQLETAVAKVTEPIGRQSMTRIRGGGDVRLKTMLRILLGARRLKSDVTMNDIFDLDPESPYNRLRLQ
ncbi:MAG: hypothetical protein M3Q69_00630 [Acidobacteriota bacterium]|nr:hypothetical protein [Acidobacteriota bacterium]